MIEFHRSWLIDMIPKQWLIPLYSYWSSYEFFYISEFLAYEYQKKLIFPAPSELFNCLKHTTITESYHINPIEEKQQQNSKKQNLCLNLQHPKIVIVGEEPYFDSEEIKYTITPKSHGYAFSIRYIISEHTEYLKNIFLELKRDPNIELEVPDHGNLESWSKQGIILLNRILSVESQKPNSHNDIGWEIFTDGIIKTVSSECENIVFILFGYDSCMKRNLIDNEKHLILEMPYPTPNSYKRGFYGSNVFSKANEYLVKHGKTPINWNSVNED